jgi:hypothetical protein
VSYDVLFAARDANDVVTLTLDSVSGLVVGEHVHVYNVGNQVDGGHTLTGVDVGEVQVTFHDGGQTFAEVAVTGVLVSQVTWITDADVEDVIGVVADVDFLTMVTDAANDWAYRRRFEAGYMDNPTVAPGSSAKLGTVMYAVALYREKGSVDSFQSFQQMPMVAPTGTMGQILRLLGIGKPRVA